MYQRRLIAEADIEEGQTNTIMDVSTYTKGIYFWKLDGGISGKLMVE